MRAVVQRVHYARVTVDDQVVGRIAAGLLVYAAASPDDRPDDIAYLVDKIANLRIFNDDAGKLNRSVQDIAGQVLVISAFALYADARKGRRPSFSQSAPGDRAKPLIDQLIADLRQTGLPVETGRFAAHMHVDSSNDGPITILLDSRRQF